VLLLGHGEERDVVEQELLKRIGGEVQQLVAGAVKDDLLEVADFALDVYSLHVTLQSGGLKSAIIVEKLRANATLSPSRSARWMHLMSQNPGQGEEVKWY